MPLTAAFPGQNGEVACIQERPIRKYASAEIMVGEFNVMVACHERIPGHEFNDDSQYKQYLNEASA